MTGKLEGFQSISTNTSTNEYCKKQNTKNDPDNICTHCYSWTMLKTFRKNMAPALERNSILLNSVVAFFSNSKSFLTLIAFKNCG